MDFWTFIYLWFLVIFGLFLFAELAPRSINIYVAIKQGRKQRSEAPLPLAGK